MGVLNMARFYDSINEYELAKVEAFLKSGGIEYSIRETGNGPLIKQILVAEEDMVNAEQLLGGGVKH
jgi:hypothetical protein